MEGAMAAGCGSPWVAIPTVMALVYIVSRLARRNVSSNNRVRKHLLTIKQYSSQLGVSGVGDDFEGSRSFDWRSEEPRKLRPFKDIYHITMGKTLGFHESNGINA
jgi:hypothetical protein